MFLSAVFVGKYAYLFHAKVGQNSKIVGQQGFDVKNRDRPSYIGTVDTYAKSNCVLFLTYLESQGQSLDYHCLANY